MAALEKIRSKAVLLVVFIGVALLAFILTDFLNSGRAFFGDGNTVAKVGDTKIDALDFQRRYETMSQQMQSSRSQIDGAMLQSEVMNQMIQEILLNDELDALDINVSDVEITEAIIGNNVRPEVLQFVRQSGMESPAEMRDMIFNPSKYGISEADVAEARTAWLQLEENVENNMKLEKLQTLVMGAIRANDLDKKEMAAENAVTNTIQFARVNYSTLKNDDYEVSDSEIQAEYNKRKELYKLPEELRVAHIIAVDITPSTADLNQAQSFINGVYTKLVSTEGVDEVRNNAELTINENTVRLTDLRQNDVRDFVAKAAIGDVTSPKFQSNTYTMTKLIGKEMGLDSVNVSMMSIAGPKNLQDSVLNLLNAGTAYAEIQKIQGTQGQENFWQTLIGAPDSTIAKFRAAGKDYFVLNQSEQGAIYVKINELKKPKQLYDVAQISYTVYPSTKTTQDLRDSLQSFINTNNTAELFEKNAARAGYNAMSARVISSSPQINGIESSREVVRWLFEVEPGTVSPIFDKQNKDKMMVASLDYVYKEGYLPANAPEVKNELTAIVRNSKKGDALMEKFQGKASDIAGYAKAMDVTVDTTTVTFGQNYIAKIGSREADLTASVAAADSGKVMGPLKANTSLVVYEVIGQDKAKRELTDLETEQQFARTRGNQMVMQQAINILRNATDVENMMIRFY